MKKCLIILCLCINMIVVKKNQAAVVAYLTYAVFETPGQGPYLETYISVIGSSLTMLKKQNGYYQGEVEVTIQFLQNSEMKSAKKYVLNSPETPDTLDQPNFIDQQRFELPNGEYSMEITIRDKNDATEKPFVTKMPVKIDVPAERITISDIQLLESYRKSTNPSVITKSGYDLVPYVSTLYPENISELKFYAEIYHSSKLLGEQEKLVISYFIESAEKHLKDATHASFLKSLSNEVNVVLTAFNIDDLPTGNYNLVIEVRARDNKLLADKRTPFQRLKKEELLTPYRLPEKEANNSFVKKYTNKDTLADYIHSLRPVSSTSEIQFAENLLKQSVLELEQQYFFNFWQSRNATDPEAAWRNYHQEVLKVNKEFATYGVRGYDTDRGRVYLQYGPPDSRNAVNSDPGAYPYEIWQYNSLVNKALLSVNPGNKQSNKRFVFYNPDLVTNRYRLIHSDARGEIINTGWQSLLKKRSMNSNNNQEKIDDNFGSGVNDNYINPK